MVYHIYSQYSLECQIERIVHNTLTNNTIEILKLLDVFQVCWDCALKITRKRAFQQKSSSNPRLFCYSFRSNWWRVYFKLKPPDHILKSLWIFELAWLFEYVGNRVKVFLPVVQIWIEFSICAFVPLKDTVHLQR